ncbi:alpha/beta fold hydrolase [Shewanella sp. SR44-3]|uniref:alpha/beta fold hydrolase n=1 Tax=unclassified Shewanella TaxID=196818 RepID=UPI0015FC8B1B|nr:alpha/beta hydrolase [Shewanella sp. SR44-3]MBB1270415.1 alpha/beta fold hydrolase [Shewanella sp. SR44-3]
MPAHSTSTALTSVSLTLQLEHIQLGAKRYGMSDKPIILALHGWLDNADSFAPLAEAMSDNGLLDEFQLLAVDWPGHGLSEHRKGAYPLHWIDYIYDLDVLIEHLQQGDKTQKILLLGHSLGGIIASAYNASFPDNVSQLVLIEALAPLFESVEKAKIRLQKSIAQHKKFNLNRDKPTNFHPDLALLSQARHRLTGLAVPWCELLMARNTELTLNGYRWRSDPRLKLDSAYRFTFEQVDALMSSTHTPSLVLLGENGFEQLKQQTQTMAKWFDNAKQVQLKGDHHLHMGNATGVAAAISDFIHR